MEIEGILNTSEDITFDYQLRRSPSVRFPSHLHNAFELIFFIRGNVTYLIEDRKYEKGLERRGMKKIMKYGMAFCGKECMVVMV